MVAEEVYVRAAGLYGSVWAIPTYRVYRLYDGQHHEVSV